ncbi:MAG: thioesterase domain-containing protein [Gammaproteobacteria bacterium]|nr:thioesterase domain-containing protein [Gammaproteobacteria bacterium]
MDRQDLENYLHEHIPLSAAMQAHIDVLKHERVVISAPLEPNINHRETVFGGSASTLATLAAWTLVHSSLKRLELDARVVIQKHTMTYDKPITDRFEAVCDRPAEDKWQRFLSMLQRRGRGRIHVQASLNCQGQNVGQFGGDFVAIKS